MRIQRITGRITDAMILIMLLLLFRSLPVALIGTLAAIYLAGFSINILTLLALVLATGLVVDDAIVVLENIVRRRNEGIGPRAAAVLGAEEVFFAVLATTATLIAVFVPLSFLPGQTGGLFREFGFTLAMAVMLSSVVALTLAPMDVIRALPGRHGIHRITLVDLHGNVKKHERHPDGGADENVFDIETGVALAGLEGEATLREHFLCRDLGSNQSRRRLYFLK